MDSIRAKTVTKLMGNPDADVKFILRFYEDKQIPAEYFSNMFNHVDFLKYKYFLIVDGAVIASNHMWGFATGCVPFIVSNAVCWFSPFLKPYENYIPVAYDLSDLETQIKWVKENDGEAKRIAENAIEFSKIVFGSEFQHLWLEKQFVEMATE
jgi:hypothetical protein